MISIGLLIYQTDIHSFNQTLDLHIHIHIHVGNLFKVYINNLKSDFTYLLLEIMKLDCAPMEKFILVMIICIYRNVYVHIHVMDP